jgi:hypothetical protein
MFSNLDHLASDKGLNDKDQEVHQLFSLVATCEHESWTSTNQMVLQT